MKFAGIKYNRICIVSDNLFSNSDLDVIEIPPELSEVSAAELITDYFIKDVQIKSKKVRKPAKQMKVALVSNFREKCGLSTYVENLFPEIAKHVGDVKLFIEENDLPTGDMFQLGEQHLLPDQVVQCWKRGKSLKVLAENIKDYSPDVILINHEWGIFPDPKHWLSFLTQLSDYRVITIMHSTFPHHLDKLIVEASMKEIVVHLEGARQCLLNEKHVPGKVYMIPHGCYPIRNAEPLWNIYKSDYTFISSGFGLRYKCYEDSIKAVAILKQKYPNIFFTAIFSESPFIKSEHEMYYRELADLIEKLDIKENVGIIRGFQSDNCMDAYFRTNKVAVFPYKSSGEHFVYGASGASRLAMSKNIPVITSSIPHFSDTPSIKADTPEEIAHELDKLFSDPKLVAAQLKKRNEFIEENSWENTALKYIKIFENG